MALLPTGSGFRLSISGTGGGKTEMWVITRDTQFIYEKFLKTTKNRNTGQQRIRFKPSYCAPGFYTGL
ncbi:MAG: hypothetical protein CVU39_11420 [Chloroflexi bacterium HGW-Chloroflexi-10]|nr:MAG: hypothetical protein CVU39_11420 [Chloroflexi bacterium HGW-Chloroflexi-10]